MELLNRDKRDGYDYDPIIKGYDASFWATTAGTPAISGTVLRFNASAASSYLQHMFADIEFDLNVAAKPTAGDVRRWGLTNPSSNGEGGAFFDITGTAFTANVYDDRGNHSYVTLTWNDSAWSAAATLFRIRWEPDQVIFYIAGVIVATFGLVGTLPTGPLAARIVNSNSDNMDLSYMRVREAAAVI